MPKEFVASAIRSELQPRKGEEIICNVAKLPLAINELQ
jgi:hypothetical protein